MRASKNVGDHSPIQWTDATWNPVVGCKRVSPGCDHCYAFQLHDQRHIAWKRGRWPDAPKQYHQPFSRVQLLPDRLSDPLHWRKPRRVFVNSMSDLFHEDVPDDFILQVFGVMAMTPRNTYQILTKRPERMRRWLALYRLASTCDQYGEIGSERAVNAALQTGVLDHWIASRIPEHVAFGAPWPLPNVWLGVSVENQATADERIPLLAQTPAAVRFLSCEPLLERIDINSYLGLQEIEPEWPWEPMQYERVDPSVIGWVIVGGESGPHARDFRTEWTLIEQCHAAGVPIFIKQLGTGWARKHHAKNGHGGDPSEWPEHLRVREWPQMTAREAATA